MVWAQATEPGAVPITAMRHPAASVTAAGIPDPEHDAPAAWAALHLAEHSEGPYLL